MSDSLPNSWAQYWHPDTVLVKKAMDMAHGLVLDLCPGASPLPYEGSVKCGWGADGLDVSRERLPFEDQEVDFLYCRHTLEDLLDPAWTLSEIARVAKAGWIETPSAAAELCRGVDVGRPNWRGFVHHRSIFWVEGDTLMTCAKYPQCEYLALNGWNVSALLATPQNWSCVYTFTNGQFPWKQLRHELDFWLPREYPDIIARALSGSGGAE